MKGEENGRPGLSGGRPPEDGTDTGESGVLASQRGSASLLMVEAAGHVKSNFLPSSVCAGQCRIEWTSSKTLEFQQANIQSLAKALAQDMWDVVSQSLGRMNLSLAVMLERQRLRPPLTPHKPHITHPNSRMRCRHEISLLISKAFSPLQVRALLSGPVWSPGDRPAGRRKCPPSADPLITTFLPINPQRATLRRIWLH